FVGPLVPGGDVVFLKPLDVGVPAQEPEQLDDDRTQMELLRREDGKPVREVEAHLVAEDRSRSDAGAIGAIDALVHDSLKQVQVLTHRGVAIRGSGETQRAAESAAAPAFAGLPSGRTLPARRPE